MNKKRFIKDMQDALKESVDFFSPKRKDERELWVGTSFLENLGISFDDGEVFVPLHDPPDVIFREARFEIKEILDPGRKRHSEYKHKLNKSYKATKPDDFLEEYTPTDLTPTEIGNLILEHMDKFSKKYDKETRSYLDLLVYVNLINHLLKINTMPEKAVFAECGWRSVSTLMGWGSLVFFATDKSPLFLKENESKLILKKFED
jgi:hypothetical protein